MKAAADKSFLCKKSSIHIWLQFSL